MRPEDVETDFDALDDDDARPRGDRRVYLVVDIEGAGSSTQVLELAEGEAVVLGRVPGPPGSAARHIVVQDTRVSRAHAHVRREGGALVLTDLGSRNGTRLNGQTLHRESRALAGGDVVRVGPAQMVVAVVADVPLEREAPTERQEIEDEERPRRGKVVVAEPAMRTVFQVARRVGRTELTVLVVGETGAGKEIVAEEIHRASARACGPFVRLNCASLPEALLESELFGYEKGAFTGADRRKAGFFEAAHGGTLLLDEIGEMTPATQAKLLLVLENRVVTRLGSTAEVPVDVRVVSATHRDLESDVASGRFRRDLYYRVATFTLRVPPLRERPAEILLLAELFARELAKRMGAPPPAITTEAQKALLRHGWPGNVRELRNAIEHAVVMADGGPVREKHLPDSVRGFGAAAASPLRGLRGDVAILEKNNIEAALAAEGGNQTKAARRLGISRRALVYKLGKYGIR